MTDAKLERRGVLRSTIFLLLLALPLSAQQQQPLIQQKPPQQRSGRFRFQLGPLKKGGELRYTVAEGGKIEAERDEYLLLENDVHVFYQDVKAAADKITINLKTKDVAAEGHVVIDQGPTRISATRAVYNLDSRTGTFFVATAAMEPSVYFTGEKIEKVDEDTYRLTNGVFTSCDLDRPAWSFHLASAEVTLDDYAHMKNISFRARDIPIFWAPRLIWPTKPDRARGFLIPRYKHTEDFGERFETAYFLPFGDSADATIHADIHTSDFFGAGINLRYVPTQNIKLGDLGAYAVRDPDRDKIEWKYQYRHAQENLPGGFRGVVDIQDYSNLDFFRVYDTDPRLQTLSNVYSSTYLTKNRPGYSVNILADRREIVGLTISEQRVITQRFEQQPSLQLRMYPQRVLGSPLYFSMESSTSHLKTTGFMGGFTDSKNKADYFRADVFPTLSLQLRTPAWFSLRPQISARATYYTESLTAPTLANPNPTTTVEDPLTRFYGQAQLEFVGPSFSRVFNKDIGGFLRFKHVIEPRIRYLYTTNVNDQDRVIRFDTVDTPFLPIVRDSVEYSLTQRLIGREKGGAASAREVLSLSFRQTVSLSNNFTQSTGGFGSPGSIAATGERFTPFLTTLRINPYQTIAVDASVSYGNVSHQIDSTSLSANLVGAGEHADRYLGFTWYATYAQPGINFRSNQYRINTGANLWKNRLRTDVGISYDATRRRFLEQRYILGGTGSCWGVAFDYRRYLVYLPRETPKTNYGILVTLKNVGTIGTH